MSNSARSVFLRKHLLKIIIICVSIVIFSVAFLIRHNALNELKDEKNKLQQQQATNNAADEAASVLNRYLEPYQLLKQQGVIGDPRRLQWLESVQANAGDNRIPKLNFTLSSLMLTTDASPLYHNPELKTKTTLMQINFSLLHEGDFYHLFNELQLQVEGVFNIEECTIRRSLVAQGAVREDQKLEGKLNGNCYLRWYSIADVTESWGGATQ